jgi:hypothetical protein
MGPDEHNVRGYRLVWASLTVQYPAPCSLSPARISLMAAPYLLGETQRIQTAQLGHAP